MPLDVLAVIGAYLMGSIPFGLLVTKALGEPDPRTAGSKNIGFTNVLRISGKKAGSLTLLGDIGKGALAVILAQGMGASMPWVLLVGFSVILGHIFSVFLSFKGGKGVATALGSVLGLDVLLGTCLLGIWIGTALMFRYSSGGALAAFFAFPLLVFFLRDDSYFLAFSVAVLGLIVYCHRENISRLLKGTESKMNLFSI